MPRQPFSLMSFLPAVRTFRLSAILCALLVLWAAFDSPVLLLASTGVLTPASPNSSTGGEDDDDDYVLDLTGVAALGRSLSRNAPTPSPKQQWQLTRASACYALPCHRQTVPTTPVCEHESRNGTGTPLLC
jgi:hypothetical protein